MKFGYQIENKPRGDFEIKGVAPALIERFSKRHREIDQQTRELLAREPEKAEATLPPSVKTSRTRNGPGKSGTSAWQNCKPCGTVS